ncbi:MAG TPA: helix-turn-helix domain-containing protein [Bryobacteraceae bacterium]|nr:helix-turn-helix domain-containing protein [Bryobacteraceae bacterium]
MHAAVAPAPSGSGVGGVLSDVLTIPEVAEILRCSRNHVSNAMNGTVPGLPALPHFVMGRRKLVRREWLSEWLQSHRSKC